MSGIYYIDYPIRRTDMNISRMESLLGRLWETKRRLNVISDQIYGPQPECDQAKDQRSHCMLSMFDDVDTALQDIANVISRIEESMLSPVSNLNQAGSLVGKNPDAYTR